MDHWAVPGWRVQPSQPALAGQHWTYATQLRVPSVGRTPPLRSRRREEAPFNLPTRSWESGAWNGLVESGPRFLGGYGAVDGWTPGVSFRRDANGSVETHRLPLTAYRLPLPSQLSALSSQLSAYLCPTQRG